MTEYAVTRSIERRDASWNEEQSVGGNETRWRTSAPPAEFDRPFRNSPWGERAPSSGGKGHVNTGLRGRKWDENPSKSNQLSHVLPHPLLRCIGDWIGRKILAKWRKSTFRGTRGFDEKEKKKQTIYPHRIKVNSTWERVTLYFPGTPYTSWINYTRFLRA